MEINKEKPWFNFKIESGKATIEIFGVIGWDVWLQKFSSDLKNLGEDITDIEVLIASDGGYITDGIAIYNMLKMHSANIITNIISHAWSIASIIALAGDERKMASNATIVIHNPWGGASGEAKDFRKNADVLDMQKENLINTYKEVLNKSREEISVMMDAETWLLAEEALDLGFITEITGVSEQAAAYVSGDENSLIKNSKAKFKALNNPKPEGTKNMTEEEIKKQAEAKAKLDAEAKSKADAEAKAKLDAEANSKKTNDSAVNLAEERDRSSKITEICNQAGAPEKAADFIKNGHTVDKAKAELFDSLSNDSIKNGINDSKNPNPPADENPLLTNMQARYPQK